jgi:DNA invertase Pin-like site-specific DNA recombinase
MAERAGIWLRVSSGGQDEASQEPDVLRYCADKGYEVVNTYTVHGKSAYKGAHNPDWQRVVKDVKSGAISVVVMWKVDRLDRQNMLHAVPMANAVLDIGGRIEFATQPYIDLTTMPGRMAFGNLCELAHEESRIKSDRVMIKHNALRAANSFIGRAPFGYRTVCAEGCGPVKGKHPHHKTMEPDPETAPYVKGMADRYLRGATFADICGWLDAEGVKPAAGGKWWHATVARILGSPTLIGRRKHGGVVSRYEPILDMFTYRRLQARLAANPRPVAAKNSAAFAGVAYCVKCGRILYSRHIANTRKDGSKQWNFYYRCDGTAREPSRCRNMIPMADLDAAIELSFAAEYGSHPWPERVGYSAEDYSQDLEDVNDALNDLMGAWTSGLIPDAEFDTRQRELRAERTRLADLQAKGLSAQPIDSDRTLGQVWAVLDAVGKRELLHDMGVRVLAYRDEHGNAVVVWTTAKGETEHGEFATFARP